MNQVVFSPQLSHTITGLTADKMNTSGKNTHLNLLPQEHTDGLPATKFGHKDVLCN